VNLKNKKRVTKMDEKTILEEINKDFEKYLDPLVYEEKKELVNQLVMAQKDLTKTQSKAAPRDLRKHIDDLKMDLGWILFDCGRYEEGLTLYESLSWTTHGEMKCNGMARALTQMGHHDEAGRLLQAGLRRFPDSYALWIAMGGLYDSMGDNVEGLKCFETALQFAPEDDSTGLYNKALILGRMERHGDALPIFNELVERYPGDPKYLADRGACLLDMGYPREALQNYQEAMEIWENSPDIYTGICIYTGLCSTFVGLGMKREAIQIALEGLKKFPDEDPALYQNAGAAFYDMGWRQEAIEILKKGIEKFPEDQDLRQFLREAEDDAEDPDGVKPPILGLMLLMAMVRKGLRKK
jgi:tetratricopeptide (TPR) repeat protein